MPPPAEGIASRLFLGPALRAQPDRRLVTLVREGYEAAFEEIVRRYGRPLGRYAASIVGGRSEDVLQEAFAKALPALQRDDVEIDLRPWLFRIVRNTALNDLRDSPPSPELLAEALAGGRDPADELEQRERLADLMRRLRELPEPQRAAIVMRELEGLGHEEIAAALGLTDGGARQAIYRARQALRDGAGLLLPLPLLRLLIDHGGEAVGAGAGGALAMAGASAGGAGASGALKLGVVAAVVAGSVGAGVAVQSHKEKDAAAARPAQTVLGASPPSQSRSASPRLVDAAVPSGAIADADRSGHGSGSDSDDGSRRGPGSGEIGAGRESSGGGPGPSSAESDGSRVRQGHGGKRRHGGSLEDNRGRGGGGNDGRSGPGRGDDSEGTDRRGGHGESVGSGHDGSGTNGDRGGGGSGSDGAAEVVPPPSPPQEPSSDDTGGGGSGSSGSSDSGRGNGEAPNP